ncbi:MAG TPA: hypothetical protein ENG67_01535 [candidate division WOR-3 bacterium]|uniref:Dockerin domain-containing protein n=1 Tax=candidate division WOR-3 bacterium TaxID=2052148 RepID=A0A7C0XA45_UNCW3|nr:hypothetical protein [candidate division WOR-3 bacterium]
MTSRGGGIGTVLFLTFLLVPLGVTPSKEKRNLTQGNKVAERTKGRTCSIKWYVFDVGGIKSISGSFGHRAALGQCMAGKAQSSSYDLSVGFFYPQTTGALCGDVNGDGGVDFVDLTYLAIYLFEGGQPPASLWASDVNGDGTISASDLTYLANYLFAGGPPPDCPGEDRGEKESIKIPGRRFGQGIYLR